MAVRTSTLASSEAPPKGTIRNWFIKESGTWSPPEDITAYVMVIGAGGSGANESWGGAQTGGSAGGTSVSKLDLFASTTYTATVGAGGTNSGEAGGLSSFTGSDITDMIANGGLGGIHSTLYPVVGPAGGTASGGNIGNYTGGSASTSTGVGKNTCGGSVNLTGNLLPVPDDEYQNAVVDVFPFNIDLSSLYESGGGFTSIVDSQASETSYTAFNRVKPFDIGYIVRNSTYSHHYYTLSRAGAFTGGPGYHSTRSALSANGGAGGFGAGGGGSQSSTQGSGGDGLIIILEI